MVPPVMDPSILPVFFNMNSHIKKGQHIFILYWILLIYILSALIWWFVALSNQNHEMALLKLQQAGANEMVTRLAEKRKTNQYIGEGTLFLLFIITGAIYIFRSVRTRLRQTQQQEDFMMAITHELKTPIAIASLNLETLQKRKLEESQQQHIIQNTLEETKRLDNLCNNLLFSSRMEAGGYIMINEEMDLSRLVKKTTEEFRVRYPDRAFTCQGEDNIFVWGDEMLFQMCLNNLLDNAVKYSPRNSEIEVVLKQMENRACLSVKDQGKGLSDTEKEKVFERYYRSAGSRAKGTGLGLYLAKKIAVLHKANISVTNNLPLGSIFTIELKVHG
jgi:signal transduction histidine kinase